MAIGDADDRTPGVLNRTYRWITLGMCALILLTAFEALAIETVMPTISRELNGGDLYALAFSGPLGMSVIGMVAAGNWSDRGRPKAALYTAVAVFVVGLIVAGSAQTMWLFIVGRLIHGFAGGAIIVALYVIVARVYPPELHPKIFAGFAAAWVIPSLVGPLVAGLVTQAFGWRWVYFGVIALVVVVVLMVVPAMRGLRVDDEQAVRQPWDGRRLGLAFVVAIGIVGLNLAAQTGGVLLWAIPVGAIAIVGFAIRPLVPPGTLAARTGLPSVILLRGLVSAGFAGTEVYIPLLLSTQYGFSPVFAGLALSVAGVFWAASSFVQGRLGVRLSSPRAIWIGAVLLLVAVASCLLVALLHLPPAVLVAGWAFGGVGMGLAYPRLTVMTLEDSTEANQGFNSSALSISDSTGSAFSLALTAIALSSLAPAGGAWSIVGCFAITTTLCLVALIVSRRVVAVPASDVVERDARIR